MPIITISRGSYSQGKVIAEQVAERLGCRCLSRGQLQKEASEKWSIPEVKLVRAIHDAPSILERVGYKKEKYVACIQNVLLKHFLEDNVVYHGLAGHFLVQAAPHVLKIRILAELGDRVRWEMERENIPEKEAIRILQKDDEERRKWSKHLYGIDPWDPYSYDAVFHIKRIAVHGAVEAICHLAALPPFQAGDQSRKITRDLIIASDVRVALIDYKPDVEVSCEGGSVVVRTRVTMRDEAEVTEEIRTIALTIPGVTEVNVTAHSAFMGL